MRLSEFHELVEAEFGVTRVGTILRDHVLTELAGRTAESALDAGVPVREVWVALCRDFDVPQVRW